MSSSWKCPAYHYQRTLNAIAARWKIPPPKAPQGSVTAGLSGAGWLPPHRNRHVANLDAASLKMEPVFAAIAARLNQVFEKRRLGAHHLQGGALVGSHVRRHTNCSERHALLGFFIEPER